jgi:pullulanase
MGLHTTDTMKEIYKELSAIDKNVMVYGEPWTGDGSTLTNGAIKQSIDDCADSTYSNNGVACFNDTFRNAIKGSEYPSWVGGHVSGKYATASIITGLLGSVSEKTGFTSRIGRSINYVECHDNNTLIDKLALLTLGKSKAQAYDFYIHIASANDKTLLTRVCSEDTLAASFVLLAQGTPFINGGQEFLRTKNGDENSYKSSDSINQISLNLKERYNTVYNIYKGLINLRKNNRDSFGDNTNATAILYETTVHCNNDNTEKSTITDGVIKYATGDYLVYFNATDSVVNIDTEDCAKLIDISSGTPIEIPTLPSTVEAKSFVILKK